MLRTLKLLALGSSLLLSPTGCGSSQSTPRDPVALANERLQGNWRLLSFRPATALDPPFQSLLDAQMNTLTIRFEGDLFTAMGAGINTSGRILVQSVQGDVLTGTLYDRMGAGYAISGVFRNNHNQFQFSSLSPPWQGTGILERAAN